MVRVKRWMMLQWAAGVIMERDSKARVIVVDEGLCERAEMSLRRGEEVVLTDNDGREVSRMKFIDNEYREVRG